MGRRRVFDPHKCYAMVHFGTKRITSVVLDDPRTVADFPYQWYEAAIVPWPYRPSRRGKAKAKKRSKR